MGTYDVDRTEPPVAPASTEPTDSLVVTRSEERLQVDTARRPYQRVVVRRRVVTETVVQRVEVQVRREVLEIERMPVADAAGTADLLPGGLPAEPQVLEVVLHEERPVVGVEVVPVERVRITTDRVPGEHVVSADLRSERIDVDVSDARTGSAAGHRA